MLHRKKPCTQMSMAALTLTDTEEDVSDSSLTVSDTDQSFNAQEYNDKNPNNK
jgi:hypothetical protein